MAYRYFDEAFPADIGFTAGGRSAEEMILSAGDATMNVMVADLDSIAGRVEKRFTIRASSLEMALFDLLGELIFYKDAEELLLRLVAVDIDDQQESTVVSAMARGEHINPMKHQLLVDVKAVTMHRFEVVHTPDGWQATVVLDV